MVSSFNDLLNFPSFKGIPSFDYHVGGGVAVGTLILIEEDAVGSFANLMLRYFVAEGEVGGVV